MPCGSFCSACAHTSPSPGSPAGSTGTGLWSSCRQRPSFAGIARGSGHSGAGNLFTDVRRFLRNYERLSAVCLKTTRRGARGASPTNPCSSWACASRLARCASICLRVWTVVGITGLRFNTDEPLCYIMARRSSHATSVSLSRPPSASPTCLWLSNTRPAVSYMPPSTRGG
jgi:hypothetical protein